MSINTLLFFRVTFWGTFALESAQCEVSGHKFAIDFTKLVKRALPQLR